MVQPMLFVPALSMSEAEARIAGLVGGVVAETRGPKRTLLALASALDLTPPLHETNGTLGGTIADELGVPWPTAATSDTDQVTLLGLNSLLEAALEHYLTHTPPTPSAMPPQFSGPTWSWFTPARSKIEAVNRISTLTNSGPEVLGPGGKERKSVFVNLTNGLGLGLDTSLSKVDLGAELADALGVTWTPTCASTGYTITLEGLNVVLAGAERRLLGTTSTSPNAHAEATLLVNLLAADFSDGPWDGKASVIQMRDDGYGQWRQMEWPGFYFEYRGLRALHSGMGHRAWTAPPQKYGVTVFDYAHHFVWDMKAHTERVRGDVSGTITRGRGAAPLNDQHSTELCAADTGVGLLIVNGEALVDETRAFDAWHKAAVRVGKAPVSPPLGPMFSRGRKKAFTPLSIDAYRWDDVSALNAAVTAGGLVFMAQGHQPGGAARPPKYMLNTRRAVPWRIETAVVSP
jgi:hypothetical protein